MVLLHHGALTSKPSVCPHNNELSQRGRLGEAELAGLKSHLGRIGLTHRLSSFDGVLLDRQLLGDLRHRHACVQQLLDATGALGLGDLAALIVLHVSVGALVQQVGEVLGRGHALFGDPPASGGTAALNSGTGLATAGDLVRTGQQRISGLSGALPAGYTRFATDAGPALDAAAAADTNLSNNLRDSAATDRSGRQTSGSVVNGAASDTAALAPSTRTAAGQRALITALRGRLAEQQQVINAHQARDARLAALVRSLRYGQGRPGGGMPMGGMPFGGGGGSFARGGGMLPGALSGLGGPLTTLADSFNPRTAADPSMSGLSAPGRFVGTPLGALTVNSGPREVAAAIIHEAQRRGYSPYQTTAILADAMQESNLSPKAKSPNGLWESIFQQDASYPDRRNPNLAISEFFNRLDKHGGPSSSNIWKSIFWLQQRPGDPSAEIAYARGRQGYLTEIMGKHSAAVAMYRDIVGVAAA